MNKLVYLRRAILELSKILLYKFFYDYVKPKYGKKPKLCYMNRDNFIQKDDIYKDIAEDDKTRFDPSNLFIRGRSK